ncbi:hypothetical protein [Paenirhodobacter populi]|uniref:hypothetical protein n=1 Tax=Paenirhodobacter populi TaxID=2306993 RepID=UPI000FE34903|nr:hypothetical protein [Sinirhodobacter populi]RWR09816.1 hypothetical protein D2T32_05605 [Sinirhodobacter populi]
MTTIDRSRALMFAGGVLPINGVSPADLAQERNARAAGDQNLQTQISAIVDGSAITTENSFATRDAFVAWDATATGKIAGMVIFAAGLAYVYDGVSSEIPDLPGWTLAPPSAYMRRRSVVAANSGLNGIKSAINEVQALGGGEVVFNAGSLPVTPDNVRVPITSDTVLTFEGGAGLVMPDAGQGSLLYLGGDSEAVRGDVCLTVQGLKADVSGGALTGDPTALSPRNLRQVIVHDPDLYGGEYWSDPDALRGGDSGISPINIGVMQVWGGHIRGFRDAGIYSGGGNSSSGADDGVSTSIIGTQFAHCYQGVTIKRAGYHHLLQDVVSRDCGYMVTTADVSADQEFRTGLLVEVLGCLAERSSNYAINFRGQTLGRAIGNRIRDWGYTELGVGTLALNGSGRAAIQCEGALDCEVSDNRMEISGSNGQVAAEQIGIRVRSYTDSGGVFYAGGRLSGAGNRLQNVPIWYDDANNTVQASVLTGNYCADGTIGRLHPNTRFEQRVAAAPTSRRMWRNLAATLAVPSSYADADLLDTSLLASSVSLNSAHHSRAFVATGTAAVQTINLPAPVAGMWMDIANGKASGTLRVAVPDGSSLYIAGMTKTDYASTNIIGAGARFLAISSAEWIAVGAPTGWT